MSFADPPEGEADPRPVMAHLIETCPEFATLRAARPRIEILMRTETKMRGGKMVLGMLALPSWQGALGPLAAWLLAERCGAMPDFLMLLDQDWWSGATARDREALVFHELMHAGQATDKEGEPKFDADGLPVWAIREHDITAFNAEVARYGAWTQDIRDFLTSARENRV